MNRETVTSKSFFILAVLMAALAGFLLAVFLRGPSTPMWPVLASAILVLSALVLYLKITVSPKTDIEKFVREIDQIAPDNMGHRLRGKTGGDGLAGVAGAVNRLLDRIERDNAIEWQTVSSDDGKSEEEKNILAAFMSELSEGVLVCNVQGEIRFCNRRAGEFLAVGADGSDRLLGSAVSTVIDKSLIEHALDEINEKLKRDLLNTASLFITEGAGHRNLQVRAAPILNRLGQYTGFILVLTDVTRRMEEDNWVESLLQSLTRSARSPLASIRSSIEAIIEYPEMNERNLGQFKEIIHKESVTLSNILNKVAEDYSMRFKVRGALAPMPGRELVDMIARRSRERLGIVAHIENLSEDTAIAADSYSLVTAILFILDSLKTETWNWEFYLGFEESGNFANLDIRWRGSPVGIELVGKWRDCQIAAAEGKRSLTLGDVLARHNAEILSYASRNPEEKPYVRIILPAGEGQAIPRARQIAILPESPAEFYNFDTFNRPGQNPELDRDLLTELTYTVLLREISEAAGIDEIVDKHGRLPKLIGHMIEAGAKTRKVTWLITSFSDAILKKIVEIAINDMGPPPVKFAFIILGSEGRKEQTLKTDQDNAIIYADPPDAKTEAQDYFKALGEKVCNWLDRAGYDFCAGNVMAKNPEWCRPLSEWKEKFSSWIHAAGPEDLLHSSIFFDFRHGFGDMELVRELGDFLSGSISGWSGFLRHMTENALHYRPPIGFFGNFVVEKKGPRRNMTDIKGAMTPIIDFARIYALQNGIRETNTQERLYRLHLKNVLSRQDYNEIEQAYGFLMQLRFAGQIASIGRGLSPGNHINPKSLSSIEQKTLKAIFNRTEKLQSKLSFDFTGMSDQV